MATSPSAPHANDSYAQTIDYEEGFADLVHKYGPYLRAVAYRMVRDNSVVQDVLQETWLKAWLRIQSLRTTSRVKAWLRAICVNCAVDWSRRNRPEISLEVDNLEGPSWETLVSPAPTPLELAIQNERRAIIERTFGRVTPQKRSALVLKDIEGLGNSEIAEILGLPLETTNKRIQRGRQEFQKTLPVDILNT